MSMKNYLKVILPVAAVAASILFFNTEKPSSHMSDLLLQNVEALAENEKPVNVECGGTGSVDCPINGVKVKYVFQKLSL